MPTTLRTGGLLVDRMVVFLHTVPHGSGPGTAASAPAKSSRPTMLALIGQALRMLVLLWRDGHCYMKIGVMLDDLRKGRLLRFLFSTSATLHALQR